MLISALCIPSYPFLEDVSLWDLQGVPGFGLATHSGSQPRAAMALYRAGHLPRDFFASPWVFKPFTKVR